MFRLVESRREIAACQRRLEDMVRKGLADRAHRNIGFPSSTVRNAPVSTNGRYWFHTRDHDDGTPRRLNWFGAFKSTGNLNITVEINTPYVGRVDRTSGYFVRDSQTGREFLAHSGRVGGGTAGVGKDDFLAWTELRLTQAEDTSGHIKEGVLVAPLDGGVAGMVSLLRYIDLVAEFKAAARAGETKTPKFQRRLRAYKDFYSEARGRRRGSRSAEIDYQTRHGEIVDAINAWRSARPRPKGSRIVKDVAIDLGLCVGSDLIEVYEAKPTADWASIYKAIGQVLVHGREESCRRILVLPVNEPLKGDLSDALARLQIEVLRFKFLKVGAQIVG